MARKSAATKFTYILDIPATTTTLRKGKQQRVKGQNMKAARMFHSCGAMRMTNPGDGNRKQVVAIAAGGCTNPHCSTNSMLKSTEILVGEPRKGGWTRGPDLPTRIESASGVTSPDGKSFLLVGGELPGFVQSPYIYKLVFEQGLNNWEWTKLDQDLREVRKQHVAMVVPQSFC